MRILPSPKELQTFGLDPFYGCGTTIDAAEKLGRQWIGIDITAPAISLIENRLLDTYGSRMKFVTASESGAPTSVGADSLCAK